METTQRAQPENWFNVYRTVALLGAGAAFAAGIANLIDSIFMLRDRYPDLAYRPPTLVPDLLYTLLFFFTVGALALGVFLTLRRRSKKAWGFILAQNIVYPALLLGTIPLDMLTRRAYLGWAVANDLLDVAYGHYFYQSDGPVTPEQVLQLLSENDMSGHFLRIALVALIVAALFALNTIYFHKRRHLLGAPEAGA